MLIPTPLKFSANSLADCPVTLAVAAISTKSCSDTAILVWNTPTKSVYVSPTLSTETPISAKFAAPSATNFLNSSVVIISNLSFGKALVKVCKLPDEKLTVSVISVL